MKKEALVIGINKYENLDLLDKCENDAEDVSEFLKKCDFNTEILLNPSQKEIIKSLAVYKKKISKDTISIIYFSGHGLQVEGDNFIVPSDANISITEEIPYSCINASDLLLNIDIQSKIMHLIILDACRNNPFKSGIKGVSGGLARMVAPMGTLIAFATSPNMTSIERQNDRNGIYTKHLLSNLKTPNIPIERVFKNTRTKVLQDTNGRQVPWEESSLHGDDFYFVKEATALIMYLKKELIFAFNELTENPIDFSIIIGDHVKTEKIPFSEATLLFKKQFEEHKNTIHPRDAFMILFNLQKIIHSAYKFSMISKTIDFRELDRQVVNQSPNLTRDEVSEFQKILMAMEHYSSIFAHNDKFGEFKSIQRDINNHIWIGFKLDGEILKKQNLIMEDLDYVNQNIDSLNEIIESELLIGIMNEFFEK
ncbi:caspase family protein [Zobellia laminariae]|uniref:caspase family protein n=1 Tax=Zobellia laminariae TaxID=248906 RepID=UPI0026F47887|nr:caspase family protein [Zobellia laminariae]WKX76270.1 caspase family protein [Zobellia laminariae]